MNGFNGIKFRIPYLSLLVLAMVLSSALVTHSAMPLYSMGIKGGFNPSQFVGPDSDVDNLNDATENVRLGFNAGAWYLAKVHPIVGIQPELLYSSKGSEAEASGALGNGTLQYQLGYLELPVLAKVYVPTDGNISPNVYAGPYAAYNILAQRNFDANVVLNNEPIFGLESETDIESQINPWDAGVAFGAGIDWQAGNLPMTLDARYTLGLVEVWENDSEVFNGVIGVNYGIGFGLGMY